MTVGLRVKYDKIADAFYVRFRKAHIADSEKIMSSIIIDYDENGEIVGIEIPKFSKSRVDVQKLITEGTEALVLIT